jgi:hypothetical protein
VIGFVVGFIAAGIIGIIVGVMIMCCFQINKEDFESKYYKLLLDYIRLNGAYEFLRKEHYGEKD